MPNVRGGAGTGFGGAATAGRNSSTSSAGARAGDRSGSAGRPGGVGNTGQTNSAPTTTSYGAPIHYGDQSNPITRGMAIAQNPQKWNATVDRVDTYNKAAREWNASAQQRSLGNFFNNIEPMGFSMQAPEYNKPATYTGGTYHMGVNPAALAGGVLGAATMIPGAGTLAGAAAGKIYGLAGGQNAMLTGPDVPKSWTQFDQKPSPAPTTSNIAGLRPEQSGGYPTQSPGGAPFGPQPVSAQANPIGGASGGTANGYFRPQMPNHTLPYGYQSAFPNSLTDQDKQLLYAKALMA